MSNSIAATGSALGLAAQAAGAGDFTPLLPVLVSALVLILPALARFIQAWLVAHTAAAPVDPPPAAAVPVTPPQEPKP